MWTLRMNEQHQEFIIKYKDVITLARCNFPYSVYPNPGIEALMKNEHNVKFHEMLAELVDSANVGSEIVSGIRADLGETEQFEIDGGRFSVSGSTRYRACRRSEFVKFFDDTAGVLSDLVHHPTFRCVYCRMGIASKSEHVC